MLGKTHHVGGSVAALGAFLLMQKQGWVLPECNEFVQLLLMYPFASFGSIFSDLDQGPDSIPSKDPVAMTINRVLRATGARHRSWQTHSISITGGFCLLLLAFVFLGNAALGLTEDVGWTFLRLAVIGFSAGIASHLFLDALTTGGVHLVPGLKIRLVPKSSIFATGGKWESIIRVLLLMTLVILFCIIVWNSPVMTNLITWLKGLTIT